MEPETSCVAHKSETLKPDTVCWIVSLGTMMSLFGLFTALQIVTADILQPNIHINLMASHVIYTRYLNMYDVYILVPKISNAIY